MITGLANECAYKPLLCLVPVELIEYRRQESFMTCLIQNVSFHEIFCDSKIFNLEEVKSTKQSWQIKLH